MISFVGSSFGYFKTGGLPVLTEATSRNPFTGNAKLGNQRNKSRIHDDWAD
jgi:hypothetical protein